VNIWDYMQSKSLVRIEEKIDYLIGKVDQMAADEKGLQDAISALTDQAGVLSTAVDALVTKVSESSVQIDLTDEIAAIQEATDGLKGAKDRADSVLGTPATPPEPSTEPVTPPEPATP
jgi:hypothetical protein